MNVFVSHIFAYIDPNSGGLLFQILAAMFVFLSGFIFFFSSQIKMAFNKVRRLWRERGKSDNNVEEDGQ